MSLVVVRATGLATVQDAGRPGRMHEAIPPGGPLVRELLAAANRRALNADAAPAIEVLGQLIVRAEEDMLVATEARAHALAAGDELVVASSRRRVSSSPSAARSMRRGSSVAGARCCARASGRPCARAIGSRRQPRPRLSRSVTRRSSTPR